MMFTLDEKQLERLYVWQDEIYEKAFNSQSDLPPGLSMKGAPYYGVIGGGLTYKFTPTSLGIIVKVQEAVTGEEIDLTDYDSW